MSDLASIIQGQPDPVQNYLRNYYGAQQIAENAADRKARLAQQGLYMTLAGLRDIRAEEAATAREKKDLFTEQQKVLDQNQEKLKTAWAALGTAFLGMKDPNNTEEAQALYAATLKQNGLNPDDYPTPNDFLTAMGKGTKVLHPGPKGPNMERKTRKLAGNMAQDYNFNPATGEETPVGAPYKSSDGPQGPAPIYINTGSVDAAGNPLMGNARNPGAPAIAIPLPPGATAKPPAAAKEPSLKEKMSYFEDGLGGYQDLDGNSITKGEALKMAASFNPDHIAPDATEPAGGGGQAAAPVARSITATNKKTGQRIISYDGGKTWQPLA